MIKIVTCGAVFLFALSYAAVTGPFRGADEPNHFFRAYQISEGRLLARHIGPQIVGAKLPVSLLQLATAAGEFPAVPRIGTPAEEWSNALAVHLERSKRTAVNFPGSALYSPAIYLPQAIAIALGRLFFDRPLILFYLARLAGALGGAALLSLAIRRLPAALQSLGIFALIPMLLFQCGVVTADTLTLGIAFAWAAEIMRTRAAPEKLGRGARILLLALALGLSQLRSPLLAVAVFAIPSARFRNKSEQRIFITALLACALVPYLVWNSFVPALFSQTRPGVTTDPGQQLAAFVHGPQHFAMAIASDVSVAGMQHLKEAMGVFAWLNFPLPWPLLAPVICALIASVCLTQPATANLTWQIRVLFTAICLLTFVAAEFAIYAMWNAVGSDRVEGFQGRYMLPFVPFLMFALSNSLLARHRQIAIAALAACILANLVAIVLLARATFA